MISVFVAHSLIATLENVVEIVYVCVAVVSTVFVNVAMELC